MTEQENGPETELEPKEVGNQVMRMVAWFAVAAVVAWSSFGCPRPVCHGHLLEC